MKICPKCRRLKYDFKVNGFKYESRWCVDCKKERRENMAKYKEMRKQIGNDPNVYSAYHRLIKQGLLSEQIMKNPEIVAHELSILYMKQKLKNKIK